MAWTSTRRGALCEVGRLSGNYDARPLSVSLFSRMRVALVCEQLYALLDMNLYIEISHRAYWRHGRVRCILSEPPNKQALRIAQDSDLRSGSDRLRPLSISLETGAKMRSPMRHTLHLWEEYTLHKPWSAQTSTHEHWHIHYSSRTPPGLAYTQHIPTVLSRISRSHLLDIRQ